MSLLDPFLGEDEREDLMRRGKLTVDMLAQLWREYPTEIQGHLRSLLIKFKLAFPDPTNEREEEKKKPENELDLIVPCLVSTPPDSNILQWIGNKPAICIYRFSTVPPMGFSGHLVVRMIEINQGELHLYRNGCAFVLNGVRMKLDVTPGQIEIQVQRVGEWMSSLKVKKSNNKKENLLNFIFLKQQTVHPWRNIIFALQIHIKDQIMGNLLWMFKQENTCRE